MIICCYGKVLIRVNCRFLSLDPYIRVRLNKRDNWIRRWLRLFNCIMLHRIKQSYFRICLVENNVNRLKYIEFQGTCLQKNFEECHKMPLIIFRSRFFLIYASNNIDSDNVELILISKICVHVWIKNIRNFWPCFSVYYWMPKNKRNTAVNVRTVPSLQHADNNKKLLLR